MKYQMTETLPIEVRRRIARKMFGSFALAVLAIVLPPVGIPVALVAIAVALVRRHNRKVAAARRLPEIERQILRERAAWLEQITRP